MLNHIVIMGRLARDPELRRTQSGVPVASFRLAVDRDFKDKNTGERGTDWIDVVAWRATGEFVSRYFTKGRMAVVEGRLQMPPPRWWPTTSISATPGGTATAAATPPATAAGRAAIPLRPPAPIPSAATAPPLRTATSSLSFQQTTATCRFDFDRFKVVKGG